MAQGVFRRFTVTVAPTPTPTPTTTITTTPTVTPTPTDEAGLAWWLWLIVGLTDSVAIIAYIWWFKHRAIEGKYS